jgi:hypothetical protein
MAAGAALHHLGEGLALVGVEDRADLLEGVQALLHRLREQGLHLGLLGLQGRVVGAVQRQPAQLALRGVQSPDVLPLRVDVTVRVDLPEACSWSSVNPSFCCRWLSQRLARSGAVGGSAAYTAVAVTRAATSVSVAARTKLMALIEAHLLW